MRHHLQFASEGRIILQAHDKARVLIITCMVRHVNSIQDRCACFHKKGNSGN